MNINVIMPLYVIWIIISALIYHLKELYVTYASENIVRSRIYIVWKTVITVEFHKATYRRKQINLTCREKGSFVLCNKTKYLIDDKCWYICGTYSK